MQFFAFSLLIILSCSDLKGQVISNELITIKENTKNHVTYLSSPKFLGRSSLTGHDLLVSHYIDSIFRSFDLRSINTLPSSSNIQPFSIISTSPESRTLTIQNKHYHYGKDFFSLGTNPPIGKGYEVVFGGNGEFDEIDSLDLNGKALLILTNNLRTAGMKVQEHAQSKGCSLVIIANPTNPKQFTSISQQLSDHQNSTQYRVSGFTPKSISRFFSRFGDPIPQIIVSEDIARTLLGEKPNNFIQKMERGRVNKIIPSEVNVNFNYIFQVDTINTQNVIGWISANSNTQQNIIVCAHFDHLAPEGNSWFPGADDNASGTAVLIELARMFSNEVKQGYKPKRNIIFAAFTAEEIGLLGSQHYSLNPLFPVDSTVIVLNFDMIGRMGSQEKDGTNLLIGGSNRIIEFDQILKNINSHSTITIDSESLAGSSLFTMSDHYYFENRGVPAYLITSGLHNDYHKPSDTAEKINYINLANIVNLSYDIIKHFADQQKPWHLEN
jgi:hypothetical protein